MKKTSIHADFMSAKAKTTDTILNATGWRRGQINPECLGIDSVFFYVYDHQTQWVWCCSVPKHSFFDLLKKSRAIDQDQSIAFCEDLIAKNSVAPGMNHDSENELAIALTAYIGITTTYKISDSTNNSNHFVIIRYGGVKTLRPFSLIGPLQYLINADTVQGAMRKVVKMDTENHPEWF